MKTVRKLFYADIVSSVAFVATAFLALFFFIDFVETLPQTTQQGGSAWQAAWHGALQIPGHFYELAPIAVLIGCIYALSRLAQSSEFTILRTAGLGPGRALGLLAGLGLCFGGLTFVVGDVLAPWSEQLATQAKAEARGGLDLGQRGAWLKDRQADATGEHSAAVHVARAEPGGVMHELRIFEFDAQAQLLRRLQARRALIEPSSSDGAQGVSWLLEDVQITEWPSTEQRSVAQKEGIQATVKRQRAESLRWQSSLSAKVVAASVMPLATMSTLDLYRYIHHLSDNEQAAQQYEIQFWKRVFYPLICLVMVALALPFAYLQSRSGGVSLKVFGGIMLGISFILLNNVASHLGLLHGWSPWLAACLPSLLYLGLSLAAFAWLVRYR